MSRTPAPGEVRARGVGRSGTLVAIGMMSMNVMVYAFTLVSARSLAPEEFGGLGAVLALLIVASVGALGLQATGARRIATASAAERADVARDVVTAARMTALVLAGLLLAMSPLLHALLDIPWLVAAAVPVCVVPLTMLGGFAGVLQGNRSWRWLTAVFVSLGLGRLAIGAGAVLISPTLTGAVVGVTMGALVPAAVGWWGCRRELSAGTGSARRLTVEIWRNVHILLAFFSLTNVDVLIARSVLDGEASGLYAAGAILTKACLFLPQFVIVVAFPTIAEQQDADRHSSEWLKPLALVGLLGAGVTLGVLGLPALAVEFVGGTAYRPLSAYLWLFAAEGTLFALLQVVVYRQIARHAASVAWWLWSATLALVAGSVGLAWAGVRLNQDTLVLLVIVVTALICGPVARARETPRPPR